MADLVTAARALISVSDKTGLEDLGQGLAAHGIEILSTGGTASALRAAGVTVRDVADVTGFPEVMDGRVKTLHPKIHGGLLARREAEEDLAAMEAHGIPSIDILVVNLYPFEDARVAGAGDHALVQKIDIGGPAMLRAAAKNHDHVAVITEAEDYAALLEELSAQNGATTARFRLRQAARAFARTASYDAAVSLWAAEAAGDPTPLRRALAGRRSETLRYGENPHQGAAFYRDTGQRPGVGTASLVQGKPLSYNNIADTDAAFEAVAEIDPAESAACVIVKHAQPCGAAMGASAADAYARALSADQVSAFGGIVALNTRLDLAAAKAIAEIFTEVIIAPEADPDAIEVFTAKPALRLLLTGSMPDPAAPGLAAKSVTGGLLVQDRDAAAPDPAAFTIATERAPSDAEMADLLFAWRMVKHVRSNAIVLAKDGRTSGIGGGQTNRVDAVRLAATRAEGLGAAKGAAMASDAFFPFADGVEAAAAAGVTSVIQPGGSKRDEEVIAAANAAGMAMVFTHRRHFRH